MRMSLYVYPVSIFDRGTAGVTWSGNLSENVPDDGGFADPYQTSILARKSRSSAEPPQGSVIITLMKVK